jgi:F-type H+-transporting ATPase subunit b
MDETLHQLAGLLIGAVPTIVLFLIFVIFYRFVVYGPLMRVLDRRRERTEGAIEQAQAAIAAAEAKTQEYEARLRAARAEIFGARQQKLHVWNREREAAIAEAQQAANRRIAEGKSALQAESEAARRRVQAAADDLAERVLRAILPSGASPLGSAH